MLRVAAILSVLLVAAFARTAYICNVVLPGFDDAKMNPTIALGSSRYDLTDNFNAISFGSFYAPSADVEGRVVVRNNLNVTSYSFGYELRTGGVSAADKSLPYSIVVGGDTTYNMGAVYPDGTGTPYAGARETGYTGGSFSSAFPQASPSFTSGQGNKNADLDAAKSYYTDLQNAFAAVAPNAAYAIQYGGITVTCPSSNAGSWSLNIPTADFNSISYWALSGCHAESQIVFNIANDGVDVSFHGDNIYFTQERVLYNILGSGRKVVVHTEVRGSILAPNNIYVQRGEGVVKGLVIVGDMQQVHQINRVSCTPPVVPTTDFCPAFETDCAGLNVNLGGSSFSLREFNVISFNNFKAASGDVEGRMAVRNNVELATYSIGYELQTFNNIPDQSLPFALIAGGDVNWPSGAIYPSGNGIPHAGPQENAFVGGAFTGSDDLTARVTGSCNGNAGCLNAAFDAALSCYTGYSDVAASKSDNVAKVFQYTGLFITCNSASATEYVVSLTPAELDSFTYVSTDNCNFQAGWIINVRGNGDVTFTGDSFPAIPGATIYNVIGNRVVNVRDTKLAGHLLAPAATLNQTGGVIQGKVVAGDVIASLQINKQDTCPELVTVPVPVVLTRDMPAGATRASVFGARNFVVGDQTDAGVITRVDGDVITFDRSPNADKALSRGATITIARIPSVSSRAVVANPDESSASVVGITFAAVLIAVLVL